MSIFIRQTPTHHVVPCECGETDDSRLYWWGPRDGKREYMCIRCAALLGYNPHNTSEEPKPLAVPPEARTNHLEPYDADFFGSRDGATDAIIAKRDHAEGEAL